MANWFECKIRYDKMQENGAVKKVTEAYLVDALTFTEAEACIIEQMTPFVSGEFSVVAIKRTKISEIFWNEGAEKWWLIKVNFIMFDEKSGKEKKSASIILVQADNSDDAQKKFTESMKGTISDYEVAGINETNYLDVFLPKNSNDR